MHTCTIIARNYLPFARVLASSWHDQHLEGTVVVLVVDAEPGEIRGEAFEVVTPGDLPLSKAEFHRMAMIYDVMELSTALKPWLFEYLLDCHGGPVTYLDPDIAVFAPLNDIDALARDHGIVLTPHLLAPMTRDDELPSEAAILQAGVFNLGFLALGSAGELLPWWQKRLRRDCIHDQSENLFVDQRWFDFVPGMWEHTVLRDPGYNVAYWNVDRRVVDVDGESYTVNAHPLRFFHFSGYSPDRPDELSRYQTRTTLRDHPALARLCDDYRRGLLDAGYRELRDTPYRFGSTSNGTEIDVNARRAARAALLVHEADGVSTPPPDPFDRTKSDDFVEFLRSPAPERRISRYLDTLWHRRPDLQQAFPDLSGEDADRFRAWVDVEGRHQDGISGNFL